MRQHLRPSALARWNRPVVFVLWLLVLYVILLYVALRWGNPAPKPHRPGDA